MAGPSVELLQRVPLFAELEPRELERLSGSFKERTFEGKAPGEALRVCAELGVRCVLFGGRVEDGAEAVALSGDPARAREDLEALGAGLGGA